MPSMIKIAMAAATVFGVLAAAGVTIPSMDLLPFSQPDCLADYRIGNTFTLDLGKCHTIPSGNPPFESLMQTHSVSNIPMIRIEYCHTVIYDQPKCKGNSHIADNYLDTRRGCSNVPGRHGMSVKFVCQDHPFSSSMIPIPVSTSTTTISIVPTSTSTVTIPAPSSTTTITKSVLLPMSTMTAAAEMTTISLSAVSSPCTHGCN
ncbi:hypothetical protein LTR91_020597 [Friedmanniomyces endolithicus]|uniref:Cyanovirin-N domain-containing protein n=1 Tax=Friedmanniomyces endolithicus TaxID=329885 RepID=A0AAN6K3Q9_9PEZI|nr:hypothetical protein LTR94_001001 [Friedmanniomyces endolithicus]KAK0791958.1 hypothetical protein LTR75_011607 [Friedmanniomyces endolithicus]KAK0794820.1 hypothetical protein LTR38_009118 [Friedmanniomyces endolithicus]KAK0807777.1 hypothetical protein LTR59_003213 [Friedmanniomyces endolithicus]KAK0840174.1 hypothetical protein LTR03_010761 [Friedmanniomyces endolithicus]